MPPSLLLTSYLAYERDQRMMNDSSKYESLMALFSMVQCILLGSFAAILGAHRSEILDKNREQSTKYSSPGASYEPPAHSS